MLPPRHSLSEAIEYLAAPFPSAWLAYGPPGTGKTTLAHIMASAATQGCQLSLQVYSGSDLSIEAVRSIASTCRQRPLPGFGLFHAVIIDEADSIPRAAQVRTLALLEDLQYGVLIFTSNDSLDEFESRFVGRVKLLPFGTQALCEPATQRLLKIAAKEGIPLTKKAAERIFKQSRSDLRASLQVLDSMRAQAAAGTLHVPPMLHHPTVQSTEVSTLTI